MIKNIFRLNSQIIVTLDDGKTFESNECTDKLYNEVCKIKQENTDVVERLQGLFCKTFDTYIKVKKSSIITIKDGSAYMPEISALSIPQMLVDKIVEAESNGDTDAITAYKNFWTLLSLNPNSAVRDNLFWFLNKWGMSICKSGLFVAYRNVELKSRGTKFDESLTSFVSCEYFNLKNKKKNPANYIVTLKDDSYILFDTDSQDELIHKDYIIIGNVKTLYDNIISCNSEAGTVYTDNHTRTFEIRLGHIVSMPREDVDENPDNQCSRGLHIGGKDWLEYNYCGNIGIKVLVNPADVCATPRKSDYGKTRTCAYYPIQIINFNQDGHVDDDTVPDGFEVDFLNKISYTGTINNEDNDHYKLVIPEFIEKQHVENIYNSLRDTASKINRKV